MVSYVILKKKVRYVKFVNSRLSHLSNGAEVKNRTQPRKGKDLVASTCVEKLILCLF